MNWNEHAKYIIGRASKLINILKVLRGTWWGGHPQTLLQIYVSLIRATIEYSFYLIHISLSKFKMADPIWRTANSKIAIQEKLKILPYFAWNLESKYFYSFFRSEPSFSSQKLLIFGGEFSISDTLIIFDSRTAALSEQMNRSIFIPNFSWIAIFEFTVRHIGSAILNFDKLKMNLDLMILRVHKTIE